jgi:hypothetical protein
MFKETKNQILDLRENYNKIKFYEIEVRLIDIEKEIVLTINTKNILIKPLVKEFISHIRSFKTRLYELSHEDRIKSLLRLIKEVDYIIEEQIKAEKYHKNLIESMEKEDTTKLSSSNKFHHHLKLTYLKKGKTEDEIEKFFKCMC